TSPFGGGSPARSPSTSRDALQAEPAGHQAELILECCLSLLWSVRLPVHCVHAEHSICPVGLEVAAPHQRVTEQERKDVVTVHPQRCRHVDLEPVVHAEQCRCAVALPDE